MSAGTQQSPSRLLLTWALDVTTDPFGVLLFYRTLPVDIWKGAFSVMLEG